MLLKRVRGRNNSNRLIFHSFERVTGLCCVVLSYHIVDCSFHKLFLNENIDGDLRTLITPPFEKFSVLFVAHLLLPPSMTESLMEGLQSAWRNHPYNTCLPGSEMTIRKRTIWFLPANVMCWHMWGGPPHRIPCSCIDSSKHVPLFTSSVQQLCHVCVRLH